MLTVVTWIDVSHQASVKHSKDHSKLVLYPYSSEDLAAADNEFGSHFVAPTNKLPLIPQHLTTLAQLLNQTTVRPPNKSTRHPHHKHHARPPMPVMPAKPAIPGRPGTPGKPANNGLGKPPPINPKSAKIVIPIKPTSSSSSTSTPMSKHKPRPTGPRRLNLTPMEKEQLELARMTDTDLACYIAPPLDTVLSMDGVRDRVF